MLIIICCSVADRIVFFFFWIGNSQNIMRRGVHSKTCWKANIVCVYFFLSSIIYLMVYERYDRIFRVIRQRNRGWPPWQVSSYTLMANVADYSNVMGPSFSVMCHFLIYFLLTLLDNNNNNHTTQVVLCNNLIFFSHIICFTTFVKWSNVSYLFFRFQFLGVETV